MCTLLYFGILLPWLHELVVIVMLLNRANVQLVLLIWINLLVKSWSPASTQGEVGKDKLLVEVKVCMKLLKEKELCLKSLCF